MDTTRSVQAVGLPTDLDGVDPTFVTAALNVRYPGTRVTAVRIADLRQGSASSLRLHIDYECNPHELPASMFLKGDFVDHEFTSTAAFAGEALYFEHLAAALADVITQPRAFFTGIDDGGQAIVILEDLAVRDVTFGDCEQPLDVDTVADGVRQVAAMQGRFWQERGLDGVGTIPDISAVAQLMTFLVEPEHFDDYIARERAAYLSAPLRNRRTIESALHAMFEADLMMPRTLVHGDAHLGNTFRYPTGKLGFCDFQAMGRGPYMWDVTYFMTGALRPEDRRNSERELLAMFLNELKRHGAGDVPSFDAAFLAHRQHMMHGYMNILTPVEMQPDRFAVSMGQRFAVAMDDLDTLGSFEGR